MGRPPAVRRLPADATLSPRAALEHVLLGALSRPPCLLSFSGGRDSSALLALAVAVARREGLPDPVPATLVFPDVAAADESAWQRLVLDHLGVARDWVRLRYGPELDAVGPVAQRVLTRHGLVWPFNLHFHLPIIDAAAGGTLVTGFGGDEVARSSSGLFAERLLAHRRLPRARDAVTVAYRLAPPAARYVADVARCGPEIAHVTWLTPRGRLALRAAFAAEWATVPLGWDRILRDWIWRSRYYRVCKANFSAVGAAAGVRVVHPFVEAPVLQSLAAAAPFAGLGDRAALLRELAGDLLPRSLPARPTKGVFTDPLWSGPAQEFARAWSGRGVDQRFVDPERLRAAWHAPQRPLLSTTLLQAAWLADHRGAGAGALAP